MKMSVREARSNFAHALNLAENGEAVIITKNGRAVAELGPPATAGGSFLQRMRTVQEDAGWQRGSIIIPPEFDDTAFSRQVLGLDD